jgi:hypothetical protein
MQLELGPLIVLRQGACLIVRGGILDEKDFKKHLKDLAHGHHHPEEHDWAPENSLRVATERVHTKAGKAKITAKRIPKGPKRRVK